MGSSPQVRGRWFDCVATGEKFGLIPAGAGQIGNYMTMHPKPRAHPRRCGADIGGYLLQQHEDGSSPQVRGRWGRILCLLACVGLIPAGAGQMGWPALPGWVQRAHPRRCGADFREAADAERDKGSSPQVRGRCYLSRGDERRFWVLALALFLLVSATVCGSGTCCGLCSSRCAAVGEADARGGV